MPRAAIDWRESAKSQRLYVRETEWEAAQSVWLWRDASASMDYSSAEYVAEAAWPTKRDRAELLLVALASLLVRGGERLTLLGSGIAPMSGRIALSRIVDLIGRGLISWDLPEAASLPAVEPLPRAGPAGSDRRLPVAARCRPRGPRPICRERAQRPSATDRRPGRGRPAVRRTRPLYRRRGTRRSRRQPRRKHPRRLCPALPPPSRRACRDRRDARLDVRLASHRSPAGAGLAGAVRRLVGRSPAVNVVDRARIFIRAD